MAIRNPDGTIYQPSGSLQQFDDCSPERKLFDLWDQDAIKIGGTPIFYREMFVNNDMIDPLYLEARDKIYSKQGVELWAIYEPVGSDHIMGQFGDDNPTDMVFTLNYTSVLQTLGYPPKNGSIIYSPFLRENWKILYARLAEFKMYKALHIELLCKRFQENVTTEEGKVTQDNSDYDIR